MLSHIPILSLLTFLPLIGAAFVLLIRGEEDVINRNALNLGIFVCAITFLLSLVIWHEFDTFIEEFQFIEKHHWIQDLEIAYHMGLDGISLFFVLLTTLLTPLAILAGINIARAHTKTFIAAFLLLESLLLGAFCAIDLVLFYLFFEAVLIPMFLIIGIWGGPQRSYAAFKFFLYTLFGSVFMLFAIAVLYYKTGTTSIGLLEFYAFPLNFQLLLGGAFLIAFIIKIPLWPLHTWLPSAHVEAPTAGSVMLAALLLKMGGYGILRILIPLFPQATQVFQPYVYSLSLIAILYASLVALVQKDMKKLVAYSSIAHMGMVTVGLFSLSALSLAGSMMQMISHGLVSAGLFAGVGMLYERAQTREIEEFGGIAAVMPQFASCFMVLCLAGLGLPGTSGFIGEILILLGVFQKSPLLAAACALGILLSAGYILWLYRRLFYGPLEHVSLKLMPDLNGREKIVLFPILGLILWLGIYPKPVLKPIEVAMHRLVGISKAPRPYELSGKNLKRPNLLEPALTLNQAKKGGR